MDIRIQDIALTSLETISAFDIATGDLKFILDELQSASIANNEEKSDLTGKRGRKLSTMKRNKSVTISGANGLVSGGLLEVQTGGKFEHKETIIRWTEYQTVKNGSVTLKHTAVGTVGDEIVSVTVRNDDGTLGMGLVQAEAVSAGKFTYVPGTKVLSFNEGEVADGTEVVVIYDRKIQGDVMSNRGDRFSEKCALYIDALGEDKCSNVYRVQIYIPKADMSGVFSMDLGDNQSVHNFEAESLAGACGADSGVFWTYTVFGANTADVTGT